MSWGEFSAVMAGTFRLEGYEVGKLEEGAVNYALQRNGYSTLVSCKRWKVAQTGVGPLRELFEAAQARDARECIYVAAGEFTAPAQAFAAEKRIRLLHGAELTKLTDRVARDKKT